MLKTIPTTLYMSDRARRATTVLGVALLTAGSAWYYDPYPPPPPLEDEALDGRPLLEVVKRLRREVRALRREVRELRRKVDALHAEQQLFSGATAEHLRFDELEAPEAVNALPPLQLEAPEAVNALPPLQWVKLVSRKAKP